MSIETERKFLVGPGWRAWATSAREIRQGYLSADPARAVRVRVTDGRTAVISVKGARAGARRPEYEYPVPVSEAEEMLERLCHRPLVEKRRYQLGGPLEAWVVDEFYGSNAGLVMAELEHDEAEAVVDLPDWASTEVTTDLRFDNACLAERPFPLWAGSAHRTSGPTALEDPADAELVVFDHDGVLVDSEPLANRVLSELLTENGLPTTYEESVRRYMGGTLERVARMVRAETGRDLPDGFAERYRTRLAAEFERNLRPTQGIEKVLSSLARHGTPFCVASSSPRGRLELALRVTGLGRYFEGRVYSADQVARGKPAPDLFLHAAVRLGADPARTVVIEDSAPGVTAAHAAGMACVGFAARTPAHLLSPTVRVVADATELGQALGP